MLRDYGGEFEMNGKFSFGDQLRETLIRYKKILLLFKVILTLLMKDMMLKLLFLMVIFIKSILHNLI